MPTSLEICAGAGGQALGLELAGFEHLALVEIEPAACATLKLNRPNWNVINGDVRTFSARPFKGVDLLAGGVPCPPFSKAGLQLGHLDERDLFPDALRIAKECNPKAIILENVPGLLDAKFEWYRKEILETLEKMGYKSEWRQVQAADFGVPQLRPRAILVALKSRYFKYFGWPDRLDVAPPTVGEVLYEEMAAAGWRGVDQWRDSANAIAPTLVGGSKKHGGADLGPTRAKQAWGKLGVDGRGLANEPPGEYHVGPPKLTLRMTALIQGFPQDWTFHGKKTPAYRQVGNAFPPPVAQAIGISVIRALTLYDEQAKKSAKSRAAEGKKKGFKNSAKRGAASKRGKGAKARLPLRGKRTSQRVR